MKTKFRNIHQQMLKSETGGIRTTSVLPPTVVDQIQLWESERNRFTYTEGIVYNQFLSQVSFITYKSGKLSWLRKWKITFGGHVLS